MGGATNRADRVPLGRRCNQRRPSILDEDAVSCSHGGCAATNPAGPHGRTPSSLLPRWPASP
eukprot:15434946-Alexandrium_andersonii.AAC.1